MTGAYFVGDAPSAGPGVFSTFTPDVTAYYLPGTTGWNPTFADRPTALWLPQMPTASTGFGDQSNQFGFNIDWAAGQTVIIEASPTLLSPVWSPLLTNSLISETLYFADPDWTNHSSRFYRVHSP